MTRRTAALLGLAALLVALLVALPALRRPPEDGGDVSDGLRSRPDAAAGAPGARRAGGGTGDLTLSLRTLAGEPIPGMDVSVAGRAGRTDRIGDVMIPGLPAGTATVEIPDGWMALPQVDGLPSPLEIEIDPGPQHAELVLVRECMGPYRVLLAPDEPLAGVRVMNGYGEGVTDARGVTSAVRRPCGPGSVWIWEGVHVRYLDVPVTVAGPEAVDVLLPSEQAAEVLVVGPDGAPREARISGLPGVFHDAEPLGRGLYRVTGPVDVLPCSVQADGFPRLRVHVPLDGARHRVELRPGRPVTVACDPACPQDLECERKACTGTGGRSACTCPEGPASLTATACADEVHVVRDVAADESEVTWDLRCGAGVTGRWSGRTPCTARVHGTGYQQGTCEKDGRFEVHGLPAGSYTLLVSGQVSGLPNFSGLSAEQVSREIRLGEGETLDVGTLEPDSGCIEGVVESDQPLEGVRVEAPERNVEARVGEDGKFLLCGLPMDEDVKLWLRSRTLGNAEIEARTDGLLRWTVHWGFNGGETTQVGAE